jgi:RimJ/RimL family protein N-acetyltransferase
MTEKHLETARLKLVPYTAAEQEALLEKATPYERAQVSPGWLARLRSGSPDPWTLGFAFVDRASNAIIGRGGFKGPPGADATVEIAYMVEPEQRGKGYATEAARALAAYAFESGKVRLVYAHTLPEPSASGRVLLKSGFQRVGDVIDPEDGPVWRFEMTLDPAADPKAK